MFPRSASCLLTLAAILAPTSTARAQDAKPAGKNSLGMTFVRVPAGSFLMGSTDIKNSEPAEKPRHLVKLSKPFLIGTHEVTQKQYAALMGKNPSFHQDDDKDSWDRPVEQVSWIDAATFCNRLSIKEKRPPYYDMVNNKIVILGGNGYRLPTEAEWEYACRAPKSAEDSTVHPFGDDTRMLKDYSWRGLDDERTSQPVGKKKPNRWGLYDMQGNVAEWVQDYFDPKAYTDAPTLDPKGPETGRQRVVKGGSYRSSEERHRPSARFGDREGSKISLTGFRVAADSK